MEPGQVEKGVSGRSEFTAASEYAIF
jgi:hypothetical protein